MNTGTHEESEEFWRRFKFCQESDDQPLMRNHPSLASVPSPLLTAFAGAILSVLVATGPLSPSAYSGDHGAARTDLLADTQKKGAITRQVMAPFSIKPRLIAPKNQATPKDALARRM